MPSHVVGGWERHIKRSFDIGVAAASLIVLSPVLAGTALAIRLEMGPPVLFRQVRPGRGEELFTLVKFRTMREAFDKDGRPLADAARLTGLGQFLRRTSLDELPQLWNVLMGHMSLVGPRPLRIEYLGRYSSKHARRHEVRPGITGWAQVNGRQHVPFSRRLDMDVWYVDHWSLGLDARILLRTALRVLSMADSRPEPEWHEIDDIGLIPESMFYQGLKKDPTARMHGNGPAVPPLNRDCGEDTGDAG
jgi:lipopolysaccharide/colanic/teichoic acid biosynthesis glycosyltransferase